MTSNMNIYYETEQNNSARPYIAALKISQIISFAAFVNLSNFKLLYIQVSFAIWVVTILVSQLMFSS